MFKLFRRNNEKEPGSITAHDLLYAAMVNGKESEGLSPTWTMQTNFGSYDFSESLNRCRSLGLLREATPAERVSLSKTTVLKPLCQFYDIPASGKKADLIQRVLNSEYVEQIGAQLASRVVCTDLCVEMLKKHDYVEFVLKEMPGQPLDYEKMFAAREANPDADISAVVRSGIDRNFIYRELMRSRSYDPYRGIDVDEKYRMSPKEEKEAKEAHFSEMADRIANEALAKTGI